MFSQAPGLAAGAGVRVASGRSDIFPARGGVGCGSERSAAVNVIADLDCIKPGEIAPEEYMEAIKVWQKKGSRIMTLLNDRKCLSDTYKKIVTKYRESQ